MNRIQRAINFIKKAPKTGRTYTEVLRHLVSAEKKGSYNWRTDRGMLNGSHLLAVRDVTFCSNGRYFYAG